MSRGHPVRWHRAARAEPFHTGRRRMLPAAAGSTTIPQLPEPFIPRARLLTVLDDECSHPMLVCAPAGFGKTALLAHWAHAAGHTTPVAWANFPCTTGDPFWHVV